jgi:asparagine synthase (glutamine-hydrolysing)
MCGIAGFVNFDGHRRVDAAVRVKHMTDALIHRGPDDEGLYVDDFAALGHRRLGIIDLASGHQPMTAAGGQLRIVFNGEIYNFLSLRAELEAYGERFETRSDTEVILLAYARWGKQCVEKLSGMFAFAIWDAAERTLFLARDRVGKKPLYYWHSGEGIAFASELKALRAAELCPDEIDPESLDCYFTFSYIPAPRTIYAGVKKLPAAHTLTVSAGQVFLNRYWNLSYANPVHRTLDEATEELEELLDEAVKCRLMSEVPIGAFLSGGIDSSLVVASMARQMRRPVITHSIGFQERQFSELPAAARIARHLGTDHHEFVVTPRAADVIERIAWHFDEPMGDSSAVPTWYVCEMARRSVTVALSGDGGDEAFAGYTFRYTPHVLESKIRRTLPALLRGALFGALGAVWPGSAVLPRILRLKTIFENLAVGDVEAFYRDLAWLRPGTRDRLYSPEFLGSLRGFVPFEAVAPYYARSDARDSLGRCQSTDIQFYMTDDVLVKVDRMSMAHSLEVRAPLLDHRILEFAARLPSGLKLKKGQGKLPLRSLAARRLPPDIHKLPKRGFSIPAAEWLQGDLREMAEDLLFGSTRVLPGVLVGSRVRELWHQHLTGARDHSVLFWGLLMLGLWERAAALPKVFAGKYRRGELREVILNLQ